MGGSLPLFRFAGIQVSLHFSWFLVAIYQLTSRNHGYHSPVFAVYEYLILFLIVLLHEFGHAFACRQVGGMADSILLWPFGGVAFVAPPQRPGAQLWSIAAGPLVNVVLIPILAFAQIAAWRSGFALQAPDTFRLIVMTGKINLFLLIFNVLPVYPLDGGQILRSLLWFVVGRVTSLRIASVIGLLGGAAFVLWAILQGSILLTVLAFFLVSQAIAGWRQAQAIQSMEEEAARGEPASPIPPRPPVL